MKKTTQASLIIFYNSKCEILLQERGSYSKFGEEWALFGGGIESGETPLGALVREAKEELDLDMTMLDYQYLGEHICEYPERTAHRNIFIIHTDRRCEDFTILEGSGCKYFTISDARALKMIGDMNQTLDIIEHHITTKM
ncbi:NUDIX hydrolase [Candidatus Gracilibacteria bacterium]|nr:NUDIX hydrolase [Candidatus Gracilibacteria bacterium]